MFRVYLSSGSTFLCEIGAMLAFLKIQCRMETPTALIDAYLLKEQCCRISSRSNLKRRNLGFEEVGHNKKKHAIGNSSSLFCAKQVPCSPSCKCDDESKLSLCQWMHIYLKNNAAKFHPDPIWNGGTLTFLKRTETTRKARRSIWVAIVPDLNIQQVTPTKHGTCPV